MTEKTLPSFRKEKREQRVMSQVLKPRFLVFRFCEKNKTFDFKFFFFFFGQCLRGERERSQNRTVLSAPLCSTVASAATSGEVTDVCGVAFRPFVRGLIF